MSSDFSWLILLIFVYYIFLWISFVIFTMFFFSTFIANLGAFNSYLSSYAIQYNAPALEGTTAVLVSSVDDSPTINNNDTKKDGNSLSLGVIIGVAVGCFVVLIIGAYFKYFLYGRKQGDLL